MEYGGTNGSVEDLAQFWKKEVEASAEWLTTQVFDLANIYRREGTILYIISYFHRFSVFLMQNTDPSLHQTKYKSEENWRRGAPKLHADLFGIEGSFRKLDIDWVFVCLDHIIVNS